MIPPRTRILSLVVNEGWVTLDGGQHVFIGKGGDMETSPGGKTIAGSGQGGADKGPPKGSGGKGKGGTPKAPSPSSKGSKAGGAAAAEQVKAHIEAVKKQGGKATPEQAKALHENLSKMTVEQLKTLSKEHGQKQSGKKAELIDRLAAKLGEKYTADKTSTDKADATKTTKGKQDQAKADATDALKNIKEGKGTPEDHKALQEHLSKMTVKQLNDFKKENDLKASGTKAELVQKLGDRLKEKYAAEKQPAEKTPKETKPTDKAPKETKPTDKSKNDKSLSAEDELNAILQQTDKGHEQKPVGKESGKDTGKEIPLWKQHEEPAREELKTGPHTLTSDKIKELVARSSSQKSEFELSDTPHPKALEEHIKANARPVGPRKKLGMSEEEDMHEVTHEGVRYQFAKGTEGAVARTLAMAVTENKDAPKALNKTTKEILFTNQEHRDDKNPDDPLHLQGFGKTAASTDGSTMVSYRGKSLSADHFNHERGHNFAVATWGSMTPPVSSRYSQAQRAEKPVSRYGATHPAEDFAEAVMMYSSKEGRQKLKSDFPKKHAALKDLLGD